MVSRYVVNVVDGVRPTDQSRDRTLDQLTTAYVNGALNRDEFDRRVSRALTAPDERILIDLVSDLPAAEPPTVSRRPASWRRRGLVALVVAGVVVMGAGVVSLGAEPAEADGCIATRLSSDAVDCPAPTKEQLELGERAAVARDAAAMASDLQVAPGSSAEAAVARRRTRRPAPIEQLRTVKRSWPSTSARAFPREPSTKPSPTSKMPPRMR